ncbi:DUF4369 domain-containing protein [Dyadobacter frigoris]|uniref:DUF4369 domain-containing protein n=1 Tax=Dyadobacter frigoris TaxID=2576211 RepID=A0A4U6DH57_9BACT|nr:DUF4369 domain-containing protein [Dyadobacter frigoris]TKT94024.1 DUF4369 domain-containing protein [Dyadobacter frigoris]GLU50753.1 hypothetical protein Dfri01_02140 [Dyadobacter frigoris]
MNKYFAPLILFLFSAVPAFSQNIRIQIVAPKEFKGRKAILLTREKGFAAIVHSIKLNSDIFNLEIAGDLVPDLYQLHVSQVKGSLFFFLEPGSKIQLDTTDVSKSIVTNSKSNPEWKLFQDNLQKPYDQRINDYSQGEKRARKERNADSLNFWVDKQAVEKEDLVKKTGEYIADHPDSYVSLYLLKINWYAFKNDKLFERLAKSMAGHRTYKFLEEKNRKTEKSGVLGHNL